MKAIQFPPLVPSYKKGFVACFNMTYNIYTLALSPVVPVIQHFEPNVSNMGETGQRLTAACVGELS